MFNTPYLRIETIREVWELVRTVVAFESEKDQESIAALLEKNGISVKYKCRTGLETIRAVKQMGGGIVVAGYKFPDMTTEHVAYQLKDDDAAILMVAKGTHLDMVENEDIFRIPAPFRPAELIGAVNMLVQLDQKRFKTSAEKRTDSEKQLISRAKTLLMEHEHYTEDQAHRYLQRRSMETSLKMSEVAKLILASFE